MTHLLSPLLKKFESMPQSRCGKVKATLVKNMNRLFSRKINYSWPDSPWIYYFAFQYPFRKFQSKSSKKNIILIPRLFITLKKFGYSHWTINTDKFIILLNNKNFLVQVPRQYYYKEIRTILNHSSILIKKIYFWNIHKNLINFQE